MKRLICIALLFGSSTAFAQDDAPSDTPESQPLQIHAFASQGYMQTTANNYLMESERGSFEFTEAGVNFTKPINENLRVGIQVFARKLGATGTFSAKLDWFYLDYRFNKFLGVRAGRVKIPFGLYNDISDIDAARNSVLLPQSIYPTENRDYLLAQTGGELYGRVPLGGAGSLEYRGYGGTIFVEAASVSGSPYTIERIRTPYVAGGRLMWETGLDGLRIGASAQQLELELKILAPTTPAPTTVTITAPVLLTVGSAEYAHGSFSAATEYSRWFSSSHSDNEMIFPSSNQLTSERGYVMGAYRLCPAFQPGAYFSVYYPDVDHRHGRSAVQNDLAGTLRFDIDDNWLVKLEGHYLQGTAVLNPALNDNMPAAGLKREWGAFFVKTTASF